MNPSDVGIVNGERFAVMAGTGVDAITMRDVSKSAKKRIGRLAYFGSGMNAVRRAPVQTKIHVNGKPWFSGKASCVLVGNVGTITGGIKLFPRASPIDGKLELAVVTAGSEIGSAILNVAAKNYFARMRPALWQSITPETTYSFPSGHAMGSATLGVALVLLFWRTRWCWLVTPVIVLFVLLVGVSRAYLGVHYPSDILAGWAAAMAWVVGIHQLVDRTSPQPVVVGS